MVSFAHAPSDVQQIELLSNRRPSICLITIHLNHAQRSVVYDPHRSLLVFCENGIPQLFVIISTPLGILKNGRGRHHGAQTTAKVAVPDTLIQYVG